MKLNTFEIILPFQGFYNSIHDAQLDDALNSQCSDIATGCYVNDKLRDRLFDCIDWFEAHNDYAKCYTKALAYEYNLHSLKFVRLISPKYYNYETDRILATIGRQDLAKLATVRKSKTFLDICKASYTSCSGFISHYKPSPKDWPNKLTEWDHNQLMSLLQAYILAGDHIGNNSQDWEYSLIDSGNLFEDAYRCIDNNYTEKEETRRVLKIADYLRQREERAQC